jgi:putative ABC transport system permease protein
MTFALVKTDTDVQLTESKIKTLTANFHSEELVEHQLCSLSKLHLSFNGQRDYYIILYFFGLIGLFILIMSAFNYINFIIASASNRGKEVAVRKISGVTQFSLITQFLSETLVLSLISALLALGVVKLILPLYNSIVNTDITIEVMRDWKTLLALILVSLSIGILSGIYPALYMSSHKIVKLFKEGMFNSRNGQINLQKALITIQFTISIFLVCLNLFFMAQINYMINKDLGFSKDNLLFTKINLTKTDGNFEDLRNRLLQNPEIINASLSSNLPFVGLSGGTINWEGAAPDERLQYRPNRVSYNFIENMGMTIVQGRDFSNDYTADINKSCLINETALNCFGWDDPLGKRINNNQWTVVGVVKDFHFTNMHNRIEPVVMILSSGELSGELIFAFRYKAGSRNRVKEILINELNSTFPNDPYEFHEMESAFLMEPVINLYNTIKKSILFFTVFNILLAIIGLLGMVSYNTNKRIKELGIRKINGSSVANIFYLLNRDFFIMLAISLILAVPCAFVAFEALPGNYKMKPQLWVPIFSAFIILLIILITTSYQTLRAARRNPVEALRYE